MRKHFSLALTLMLATASNPFPKIAYSHAIKSNTQQTDAGSALTNDIVLKMLKDGIASEIIVAKIKTSTCNFDTSPGSIQSLKQGGVPDAVILAMVEAPIGPRQATAPANTSAETIEVKVSDGTEIEVELQRTVSGQEVKVGDIVDFTTVHPVQLNGVMIINKGAPARARVTTAKKSGRWGKAGKLEWAMQDVEAVDGSRIPVRFTQRSIGDSKGGTVAVAAVATTVLLGPVGLLWGLKKGKAAIIPAGNRYPVFVHGDTTVKAKASANTDVKSPE